MRECICNSCVNLKEITGENGDVTTFDCIYGYPSETCDICETGECELECSHYDEDGVPNTSIVVHCSVCGKELNQLCGNDEEGEIRCIDCFLKDSK